MRSWATDASGMMLRERFILPSITVILEEQPGEGTVSPPYGVNAEAFQDSLAKKRATSEKIGDEKSNGLCVCNC